MHLVGSWLESRPGHQIFCVGLEVLTAVIMNYILWNITPCSPLNVNRHFGGTCRLHLHGRRISQARDQHEECSKQSQQAHTNFLLSLLLNPEDGGVMFLRNVG
jgi:hypothetical protein